MFQNKVVFTLTQVIGLNEGDTGRNLMIWDILDELMAPSGVKLFETRKKKRRKEHKFYFGGDSGTGVYFSGSWPKKRLSNQTHQDLANRTICMSDYCSHE